MIPVGKIWQQDQSAKADQQWSLDCSGAVQATRLDTENQWSGRLGMIDWDR